MKELNSPRAELARLLREVITRSRLSTATFARTVLFRDPRTVNRWKSGRFAIPNELADRLRDGSLLALYENRPGGSNRVE